MWCYSRPCFGKVSVNNMATASSLTTVQTRKQQWKPQFYYFYWLFWAILSQNTLIFQTQPSMVLCLQKSAPFFKVNFCKISTHRGQLASPAPCWETLHRDRCVRCRLIGAKPVLSFHIIIGKCFHWILLYTYPMSGYPLKFYSQCYEKAVRILLFKEQIGRFCCSLI